MSKINTRSPYFIYVTNTNLTGVAIRLRIYEGENWSGGSNTKQYDLYATAIEEEVTFEVSEIVRTHISDVFDGNYTSNNLWLDYEITEQINDVSQPPSETTGIAVFEGLGYFEEGSNPQLDTHVLQSNECIVANDLDAINIPIAVIQGETATVTYEMNGYVVYTDTKTGSLDSDDIIQYSTNSIGDIDRFVSRVTLDGGTVEARECVKDAYDDYYENMDVDRIEVVVGSDTYVYNVKEIEECKHDIHKVSFKNKFGAWQDLWFFKRSDLSITTKSEKYRSNVVSNGSYSINDHQHKVFYKNGLETLKMNSGFYPEEYNEVFKELFLSEQVYIDYNGQTLPVNVKESGFSFKNKVNEKLINYSVSIEFAFDKINSIR